MNHLHNRLQRMTTSALSNYVTFDFSDGQVFAFTADRAPKSVSRLYGKPVVLMMGRAGSKYYALQVKPDNAFVPSILNELVKRASVHDSDLFFKVFNAYAVEHNLKKLFSEKLSAPEFKKLLISKLKMLPSSIHFLFPELEKTEDIGSILVGNMTLIPHKNLKPEVLDELKGLIAASEKELRSIGLGKLLYGKIFTVGSLSGEAVADYASHSDTIRLSEKARKSKVALAMLIHEFGHRLQNKFLNPDQKQRIKDAFITNVVQIKKFVPALGEEWEYKKDNEIYVVKDTGFRTDKAVLQQKNGRNLIGVPLSIFEKPDVLVRVKRTELSKELSNPKDIWAPTTYSRTNYSEWFCEILGHGLATKNQMYLDFVKGVIK